MMDLIYPWKYLNNFMKKKIRRKVLKTVVIQTKKATCTTIHKVVQVKLLKTWVTLHRYEIEIWT